MSIKRGRDLTVVPVGLDAAYESLKKILEHFGGTEGLPALHRITGRWSKTILGHVNFVDVIVQLKPSSKGETSVLIQVEIKSVWEVSLDPNLVLQELFELTNGYFMGSFKPEPFVPLTPEEISSAINFRW